jgi:hypothetical protein
MRTQGVAGPFLFSFRALQEGKASVQNCRLRLKKKPPFEGFTLPGKSLSKVAR